MKLFTWYKDKEYSNTTIWIKARGVILWGFSIKKGVAEFVNTNTRTDSEKFYEKASTPKISSPSKRRIFETIFNKHEDSKFLYGY
jgi:hypothetical protein